jgi:hypothetical protein
MGRHAHVYLYFYSSWRNTEMPPLRSTTTYLTCSRRSTP